MQARRRLPLILFATVMMSIGAHRAQAQSKVPIYVVNEIDVKDEAAFRSYADAQSALIQKNGGHYIIRGGKVTAVDGVAPKRFTVYVFDSAEKLKAWQDEPTQKDLHTARAKAATFRSFIVEGVPQ